MVALPQSDIPVAMITARSGRSSLPNGHSSKKNESENEPLIPALPVRKLMAF